MAVWFGETKTKGELEKNLSGKKMRRGLRVHQQRASKSLGKNA